MLRMILYKNCILNKSYQIEFSHGSLGSAPTSVFGYYLNSLNKKVIDLENVYYENEGEIVIDRILVDEDIYDFNYISFQQFDGSILKFTRYCFIDKILVKNGCVYINYSEDIWNSYIRKISGMAPSFLCRSRRKTYLNFNPKIITLPKDYESNNKLEITPLLSNDLRKIYILVEIQFYDVVSGTDNNAIRDTHFFWFYTNQNIFDNNYHFGIDCIQRFIALMPDTKINNHNFQVGKIYLFPSSFIDNISYFMHNVTYNVSLPPVGLTPGATAYLTQMDITSASLDIGHVFKSGTINNNFKNLMFGTFNNKIKIVNNGTNITYELKMYRTNSNLVIQLCSCNEIIDITNDFLYEPPLSTILSEEFAQRRIAINLDKYKNEMKQGKIGTSIIGNGLDMLNSLNNIILGANTGRYSGLMQQGRNLSSSYGEIIDKLAYDIPTLKEEENSIIAPKYSNSKGNIINITEITNYIYGLFLFKIIPDNDEFVKNYVDNFGYEVYEFILDFDDLEINPHDATDITNQGINYNVIRFENINLWGSFTNEIAKQLCNILMNGVKIYYTYDWGVNDSYTDDLLN